MAGRRISKSAIDWMAFAERVPPNQKEAFRAFKHKSDVFIANIHKNPEALPSINWTHFKSKLALPKMVQSFEDNYKKMDIPFPKDPDDTNDDIDEAQRAANIQMQKDIADATETIERTQAFIDKIDGLPKMEEMTHEMYADYFPKNARNAMKPTLWPHTRFAQTGNDPHEIK